MHIIYGNQKYQCNAKGSDKEISEQRNPRTKNFFRQATIELSTCLLVLISIYIYLLLYCYHIEITEYQETPQVI